MTCKIFLLFFGLFFFIFFLIFWFCPATCGILVLRSGIRPLHWKLEVLTVGLPGKSRCSIHFLDGVLWSAKVSMIMMSNWSIFLFIVLGLWTILSWFLYMVWRDDLTLWHVDIQLKRLFFSHWIVFMPLSANQLIIMWGVISELSVLFCWSLCIPLCQFHTVLKGTEFELDKVNWTWGYTVTEVPPKCFRVFKVFLYTWSHLSLVAILGVNASPAVQFSSVQFSRSVVSASLRPHEPQHARPPCPSPTPGVHPNPCPWSRWGHPSTSSSVVPFSSCPQAFPASGFFQMSQLFA